MGNITILAAPDSFKGGMGSVRICELIESAARREGQVRVVKVPLADGGEGTVEAYLAAAGGERITCRVAGPEFEPVEAFYGRLEDGTAVVEMAQASGLALSKRRNPLHTTTLGTGQLIRHALDLGCRRFIVGIGGSATNDGGMGMAQALGVRFLDARGGQVPPTGAGMGRLDRVDLSRLDPRVPLAEFRVACDVNNPLFGEKGAAYVYGPQKGAGESETLLLDRHLRHFAGVVGAAIGRRIEEEPGAGAAGGLGFGLMAFLGGRLESGIDLLLEAARFDEKLSEADLVLTGEGRLDAQSLMGKAIQGIAARCRARGVPVAVLAGSIGVDREVLEQAGIAAAFSIQKGPVDLAQALASGEENLEFAAGQLIRFMKVLEARP